MTALVGRGRKRTFSGFARQLGTVSHVQANETKGENPAKFGAAIKRLHQGGRIRIRLFHGALPP